MPDAWRVDKKKWQGSSFDGTGAAREGGRWNSEGVRVVYVSANLAMAAMEKYVHLPKPVPAKMEFVRFAVDFRGTSIKRLEPEALPRGWQDSPPGGATQKIGDRWVASGETAILAVPSALILEEVNYLLNPAHADFKRIVIGAPEVFVFDQRIAQLHPPPSAKSGVA